MNTSGRFADRLKAFEAKGSSNKPPPSPGGGRGGNNGGGASKTTMVTGAATPLMLRPPRATSGGAKAAFFDKNLSPKIREGSRGKISNIESAMSSPTSNNEDVDNHHHHNNSNNSSGLMAASHNSWNSLLDDEDLEAALEQKRLQGVSVPEIVSKFNQQIAANEAFFQQTLAEKAARKARMRRDRRRKRKRNRQRKRKTHRKNTCHYLLTAGSSELGGGADDPTQVMTGAPSFSVDPKTYKVPKYLKNPSKSQSTLLKTAMKESFMIKDDTSKSQQDALVGAFEAISVPKGEIINDDEDYMYVIEEGTVDINTPYLAGTPLVGSPSQSSSASKVISTAQIGDTIGNVHFVSKRRSTSNDDDNKSKSTMTATQDTKLLRLKHDDYRGIVQSQAKQEDMDKEELLQKFPFLSKLLKFKTTETGKGKQAASDALDRIASIMKPVHFEKGDELPSSSPGGEHGDTLYVVKEGQLRLTSEKGQNFVLASGNHIGRKALMGVQGNEPTVKRLEALSSGTVYAIEKSVADKVLGDNFVSRQTARLNDKKKLAGFECVKKANLDAVTMDTLAETVKDKIFPCGTTIMEQDEQVEPCLYLIREGNVALTSKDGTFHNDVGPGGYFGVEQLLMPKTETGTELQPTKDTTLAAQWTIKVLGDKPCVVGVLSLIDSQDILNNDGKKREQPLVEKNESSKMVEKQNKTIDKVAKSKLKLDDLEMISVLGDGAFGEVWKVKTDVNGKNEEFALKKVANDKALLDALKREIVFLTKFGVHPFVVSLIKAFEDDDGNRYMLMNLATGGELWDVIHREDTDGNWTSGIPESQAKFYSFLLADTISFIHSKKYVYRDLKPENILIDSDGYPILCDFGFAKHCPEKTYTCCGTPNYVAPEIIANGGHNQGVDWWALGVLLYEMVTGEHPFYVDGMDQIAVFESITQEAHAPLVSTYPNDASAAMSDLVDQLLVKDPAQRLGMLSGGGEDVLAHKLYNGMDIRSLRKRRQKAPWVPPATKAVTTSS